MSNDIASALRYLQDMCRRSHDEWAEHKLAVLEAALKERGDQLKQVLDAWPEMEDEDEPINGSDAVEWLCGYYAEVKDMYKGGL